jgi:hypothetical protein
VKTRLTSDPGRDLLRTLGGLLFAAGAIVLDLRKSASWGAGGRMLAILIPAAILYALALGVLDRGEHAPGEQLNAAPWQSVLMVFAVILNALWLATFFKWIGAHGALVTVAVFVLTAITAGYAATRAGVRYAALLGTLSLFVAWLALWEKILSHPSATTLRWLLLIVGVIFVAAAVVLDRRGRRESSEVLTGAGIAGVAAGSLGVFVGAISVGVSTVSPGGVGFPSLSVFNARQHFIWDLLLLVISVALIWCGSRARVRGLGYVGGLGLLFFLFSAGAQLSTRLSGGIPSRSVVGWPLALLLIGAAALALGFYAGRSVAPEDNLPPAADAPPAPPPST